MDIDFKKYGQNFQLVTLSLLIQDKVFFYKVKDILSPEYFDNKYTQTICQTILDYGIKYNSPPKSDDIKAILETSHTATSKLYLLTLDNVLKVDLSNRQFVEEEVVNFCFLRYALTKADEEKTLLSLGKFEEARALSLSKYRPVNNGCEELDLTLDYNLLTVSKNDKKEGAPLPFCLPTFTRNTKGGSVAGNLVIVVGQSSLGKTNFLVAQARHLAQLGKKVLYFSLEIECEQIISRAVAGMTNIEQENLENHPQLIKQKIDRILEQKGAVKIIKLKSISARVEIIQSKIEEVKSQGFFPDTIIIDGVNQVKLPKGYKAIDTNDKFEYIAEELRDMSYEEKCPVLAAFQSNRGGFNVEYADEQNIGKAIEVYQVCDIMIMLTQTETMLENGQCYAQLLKNRRGKKGVMLKLSYDPNLCIFIELEEILRSTLVTKKNRAEIAKGLETVQKRLDLHRAPKES